MSDFAKRFVSAMERSGLSVAQVAKSVGVTVQAVYGWQAGALPKGKRMEHLAGILGVSVQWLAYGSGEVSGYENETGSFSVPQLKVNVSAGGGGIGDESSADAVVRLIDFSADWVAKTIPGASPGGLAVFTISGDSMEPTLHDKDFVIVDTRYKAITTEGMYVALYDGMIYAKRFQPIGRSKILMLSDNQMYKPVEIASGDSSQMQLEVLGKIVYQWSGRSR